MYPYKDLTTNRDFARSMLKLLFSRQDWINRRVDSLTFPDGLTVERSVNLDFNVPEDAPEVDMGGSSVFYLPVATIRKTPTIGFTMSDETGRTLPLLPRPIVRDLSETMVKVWAEICCGYTPTGGLEEDIGYVIERALRPGDLGHKKRQGTWNKDIESKVKSLTNPEKWCHIHEIPTRAFDAFTVLVKMLARDYLVIAVLPKSEGRLRVLKYRYDRPLRLYPQHVTSGDWSDRVQHFIARNRMPQLLEFPAGAAAYSRSYHFQIFAQEEVSIDQAAMVRYQLGGPSDEAGHSKAEPDIIFPRTDRDRYDPAVITKAATRVDLHPSSVELRIISGQCTDDAWKNLGSSLTIPPHTLARAQFLISPSRSTWLGASTFMSFLAAAFVSYVSVSGIFGHPVKGNYFPIAAFLAVVLPVIIRPESGLAKHVMRPVRTIAFVSALPPAVLAALVERNVRNDIPYWIVASISAICFLYLVRIWFKAGPSPRYKSTRFETIGKGRRVQSEVPLAPEAKEMYEQQDWRPPVQEWILSRINHDDLGDKAECGHRNVPADCQR